ncbi:hypothetical protein B566_EDAN003846 [Ephemera danica]|nr:hypothetical protein B566_EDAN003846 [Ephemera danica]
MPQFLPRSPRTLTFSLNGDTLLSRLIYHRFKSFAMDQNSKACSSQTSYKTPERFRWLGSQAPCFPLDGNQVSVISKPSDFYKELIKRCQASIQRITLASLYLGTGPLEQKLVAAIDQRIQHSEGNLNVCVLLDYTRSSRGEISSRTLLFPLISKYQNNCQVALYHSPNLRGTIKKLLPQRWNELVGLQHMKIYLFDDSVIISGANLSNDYFTNRQDRYVLIENCKDLADFLDGLVKRVTDFSFHLNSENNVALSAAWQGKEHPYLGHKEKFLMSARKHVWDFYSSYITNPMQQSEANTWLYPFIEMGQLGIQNDSIATKRIIETAPEGAKLNISTGYFNLTQQYSQSIVQKSKATFNILMAHPNANGFLGARGPAGGIPAAYTLLAHRFLTLLRHNSQGHRVSLWEYQLPGWTYHAKGLWYCLPEENLPSLTLVGSPNFGYRSVYRDLELQVALVTTCPDLKKHLGGELSELNANTSPFPDNVLSLPDRKPPLWVRLVVAFFKNFF